MMHHIPLGTTGVALSRLVYGAWRLNDDSDTSSKHILKKIERCLELGINTFDHADIYGDYECERLFGKALADAPELKRGTVNVSKCGIKLLSGKFPGRTVKSYDTGYHHIVRSVEQSLKHLGIEALDLMLIHRPDPLMDPDETAKAFDDCIQSGKIKAAGVSNFLPRDVDLLQSRMRNRLVVNQIEMSVLCHTYFQDGTLAYLQQQRMVPMAWSPLAGGRLFGDSPESQRTLAAIKPLAETHQVSIDALALAWLLKHPAQIIPVIGTNKPERISAAAQALSVTLSKDEWFTVLTAAAGVEVP